MRLAFNGPIELLKRFDWGHDHYALAHECLKSDSLVEFYAKSEKTVILDNGADEIGEGISGDQLRDLVERIRPDYCILPDVLENASLTRERSLDFIEKSALLQHKPMWMAVIQGTSLDEWKQELYFWLGQPVQLIGIPYDINFEVPREPANLSNSALWAYRRTYLLKEVCSIYMNRWGDKLIHLLGMNDLIEFTWIRNSVDIEVQKLIRSNDSTSPYAAAANDRLFEFLDDGSVTSGPKDWPSLDFNNENIDEVSLLWNLCLYFLAAIPGDVEMWPEEASVLTQMFLGLTGEGE